MDAFQVSNHHIFAARTHADAVPCPALLRLHGMATPNPQLYQIGAVDHLPRHFDQEAHAIRSVLAGTRGNCSCGKHAQTGPLWSTTFRIHCKEDGPDRSCYLLRGHTHTRVRDMHICIDQLRPVTAASLAFWRRFARPLPCRQLMHVARPGLKGTKVHSDAYSLFAAGCRHVYVRMYT